MADHGTAIEWTQAPGFKGETWNPVTGCDRVSPGCAHCYALDLAAKFKGWGQKRYQNDGDPKTSGPGFGLTLQLDKLSTLPYDEFLNSSYWAETREAALERAGHRCQVCNSPHSLQVHHRDYSRIPLESLVDLTVLCDGCHGTFHANRRLKAA